MKRALLAVLLLSISLFIYQRADAQSFTVTNDTVHIPYVGPSSVYDNIIPLTGNVIISWKVIADNFPNDWVSDAGFCDNVFCYYLSSDTGLITPHTSGLYILDSTGYYQFFIDLTTAVTTGTYYVTVRMNNDSITTDTATETFIVSYGTTAVQSVAAATASISVYPNPAGDVLHIDMGSAQDAGSVAIYDVTGKRVAVCTMPTATARMDIRQLEKGMYFVRVLNNKGMVMATRRFVKE